MTVLTQHDQEKISATIAEIEAKTAGELVVAVVSQSDDYTEQRYTLALALTLAMALTTTFALPGWAPLYLIILQVPMFIALLQITKIPAITRLLSRKLSTPRVRERAMRMFIERGIHKTRDQSGLLLMLSELEHQVVILGDSGIHEKVGDPGWEGYVERVVQGLRSGKAADSVVSVLTDLGNLLAEHFPPRDDDSNELPNQVVVES